jgi:imidazoleglycerol-phosphate dehydratase
MKKLKRETRETQITLGLALSGGEVVANTGDGFLDHMLVTLGRYAGIGLDIQAAGDLRHHLIEDVGITLGLALRESIPEKAARYGHALIPMDDALVQAAMDVGGRPFYEGPLPAPLYEHFLQSLAVNLGATLHVNVIRGKDRHHVVEAAIKATGMALRQALVQGDSVFSTKGSVSVEWIEG